MSVAIGPAEAKDLSDILELLEQNALPTEGFVEHIATALVARENTKVVGSAAVELYGDAALLRSVAVEERLRRRGLGRALISDALDLAHRHDVTTVYLLTETAADFFSRFFRFQAIPRSEVALAVQQSAEFTGACPDTAQAMVLQLR